MSDFSAGELQQLLWHICKNGGPVAAIQKLAEEHKLCFDTVNCDGETPLITAVRHGSTDVVRALLKHNAKVDTVFRGQTGIELAKQLPHLYQVFQLEAIQAMTRGDVERLMEFVRAGLDVDDGSELAPLTWAESLGCAAIASQLHMYKNEQLKPTCGGASKLDNASQGCAGHARKVPDAKPIAQKIRPTHTTRDGESALPAQSEEGQNQWRAQVAAPLSPGGALQVWMRSHADQPLFLRLVGDALAF